MGNTTDTIQEIEPLASHSRQPLHLQRPSPYMSKRFPKALHFFQAEQTLSVRLTQPEISVAYILQLEHPSHLLHHFLEHARTICQEVILSELERCPEKNQSDLFSTRVLKLAFHSHPEVLPQPWLLKQQLHYDDQLLVQSEYL
jgi:hypothetical protein